MNGMRIMYAENLNIYCKCEGICNEHRVCVVCPKNPLAFPPELFSFLSFEQTPLINHKLAIILTNILS